MTTATDRNDLPVAVVGFGQTVTARLLRRLITVPVRELDPYCAVMGQDGRQHYRAVIVEDFELREAGALDPCTAARWELSRRTDLLVVSLDSVAGRSLARSALPVFAYSDGRPQADLTAKNVNLRGQCLEFDALTRRELLRVRAPLTYGPRLYDYLAALAGALALGVPLSQAAAVLA